MGPIFPRVQRKMFAQEERPDAAGLGEIETTGFYQAKLGIWSREGSWFSKFLCFPTFKLALFPFHPLSHKQQEESPPNLSVTLSNVPYSLLLKAKVPAVPTPPA